MVSKECLSNISFFLDTMIRMELDYSFPPLKFTLSNLLFNIIIEFFLRIMVNGSIYLINILFKERMLMKRFLFSKESCLSIPFKGNVKLNPRVIWFGNDNFGIILLTNLHLFEMEMGENVYFYSFPLSLIPFSKDKDESILRQSDKKNNDIPTLSSCNALSPKPSKHTLSLVGISQLFSICFLEGKGKLLSFDNKIKEKDFHNHKHNDSHVNWTIIA